MIHQFQSNGYNIVLDVNSGSVHVVDEAAYDCIALYNEKVIEGRESEDAALSEIKGIILEKYKEVPVTEEDFNDIISEIKNYRKMDSFSQRIYTRNTLKISNIEIQW